MGVRTLSRMTLAFLLEQGNTALAIGKGEESVFTEKGEVSGLRPKVPGSHDASGALGGNLGKAPRPLRFCGKSLVLFTEIVWGEENAECAGCDRGRRGR